MMGEAKKHRDALQSVDDRSKREDAMHKRAQRAEGDLLKARAEIAQLEAEAREARAEREEWMRAIDQANKNGQQYEALRKQLNDERALADYLAEGVRDLYEHSQYLDRYNKERGL